MEPRKTRTRLDTSQDLPIVAAVDEHLQDSGEAKATPGFLNCLKNWTNFQEVFESLQAERLVRMDFAPQYYRNSNPTAATQA